MKKKCSICQVPKELNEDNFPRKKSSASGYYDYCHDCNREKCNSYHKKKRAEKKEFENMFGIFD